MNQTQTVSAVSKSLGISSRMLRYYEQVGLIKSQRTEDYAYRVYDENAICRLRQIIILRKLRVPVKQILQLFSNNDAISVIEVFERNISELDEQITALSTVKSILSALVRELQEKANLQLQLNYLSGSSVFAIVDSISFPQNKLKEETSMTDINKANEVLTKLNVRILQIAPATVASYHFIGENPEEKVGAVISQFAKESNLYEIKPDSKLYGFNHPNPSEDREHHGYEDWLTIPDDMDVPAPLVKKKFAGGMYAAHTIKFMDFHEWNDLHKWVENSDKYDFNYAPEGAEIMSGCLEDHLNWVYANHLGWPENFIDGQLDLLLPIKL
ncbi:MAG: effector binding domain-containing protein, partial [Defluviitaleaceae bacterium]|nr:effector binding domain-containing protein [Defluviitaleaceae bacterium]